MSAWTREIPKSDGYYWATIKGKNLPEVVYLHRWTPATGSVAVTGSDEYYDAGEFLWLAEPIPTPSLSDEEATRLGATA